LEDGEISTQPGRALQGVVCEPARRSPLKQQSRAPSCSRRPAFAACTYRASFPQPVGGLIHPV
jgi:hypothetical protein